MPVDILARKRLGYIQNVDNRLSQYHNMLVERMWYEL